MRKLFIFLKLFFNKRIWRIITTGKFDEKDKEFIETFRKNNNIK